MIRWAWSFLTRARFNRLIMGSHAAYGALSPFGLLDRAADRAADLADIEDDRRA